MSPEEPDKEEQAAGATEAESGPAGGAEAESGPAEGATAAGGERPADRVRAQIRGLRSAEPRSPRPEDRRRPGRTGPERGEPESDAELPRTPADRVRAQIRRPKDAERLGRAERAETADDDGVERDSPNSPSAPGELKAPNTPTPPASEGEADSGPGLADRSGASPAEVAESPADRVRSQIRGLQRTGRHPERRGHRRGRRAAEILHPTTGPQAKEAPDGLSRGDGDDETGVADERPDSADAHGPVGRAVRVPGEGAEAEPFPGSGATAAAGSRAGGGEPREGTREEAAEGARGRVRPGADSPAASGPVRLGAAETALSRWRRSDEPDPSDPSDRCDPSAPSDTEAGADGRDHENQENHGDHGDHENYGDHGDHPDDRRDRDRRRSDRRTPAFGGETPRPERHSPSAPAPAPAPAPASAPKPASAPASVSTAGDLRRTFPAPPAGDGGRSGEEAARTWWGRAWVDALEDLSTDAGRLERGRGYADAGQVAAITVTPGQVLAYVHGGRARPYRARIRLRTLSDDAWDRFLDAVAERPAQLAALLEKEMPRSLATGAGAGLAPGPGDLDPDCTCPDPGRPCKHAAALCYRTAALLDADPFVLLLMRGRGEHDVLDALARRNAHRAARRQDDSAGFPGVGAAEALTSRVPGPLPVPLPPLPHPEQPPAYPAASGGPDPLALDQLATDAAARAYTLLTTGQDPVAGLDLWRDAVRLAAARPGSGLTSASRALYGSLAGAAGTTPNELARAVAAWRQGGPAALDVLEESWDPPAGPFDRARPALLALGLTPFRPSHNRLTQPEGRIQLRLGREGQWYAYESEPGSDDWWPRGTPDPDPAVALRAVTEAPGDR
ncbi:SWIM zinc finger family protein [Streptomyces tsukubensis]|uniref:SWIM-type domain-containing protein n=1 Tax=Streptomyces tsukubensis TaxID=83656 RepID=A0A1V4ADV3_9ACTN|nr:SWIM zinc finger family protein [Streptomyces tsukubensis]OON81663.1 hypothetical protein B1H18_05790 [Streptomyces tsukubensis]QFR96440.1 hypothetical protein GBW32_29630 [Streptomyces tsukubensis]